MRITQWRVREELQQPVFTAIDALEFPELHDESIPFMAFLKQLTKLMKAAGVRDFMMQARTPVCYIFYVPLWWPKRPGGRAHAGWA